MKLLIAGGGTGGHLFPGVAIAQEFLSRGHHEILFVGTKKGIEAKVLPSLHYPLKFVSIDGLKGKNPLEKFITLCLIPISLIQSFFIIRQFNPDVILGVGGYASFPILWIAWVLRKKRAIQEQNFRPGLTNKILSLLVQKIYVSFDESVHYFPSQKSVVTGNPVRKFKSTSSIPHEKFTVFIFGGSQGAHSLNRALLEALPYLETLKNRIHLIHQTGKTDLKWVASTYFQQHWKADVYDFIDDIDRIYAQSDYVICRAGASSVAELAVLGKACLFVPYPYAAHNHQEANARAFEKKGATRVLLDWQLNGQQLAKEIQYAYEHPRELDHMRKNILQFSHPYAAQAIVDQLLA